jgi:5-methylcytosine-specific restriction endonuclease McrA
MPYADREAKRCYDAARYAANPAPVKARAAAWKKAHPDAPRNPHVAYDARYYQQHRKRLDAKAAAWCRAHPTARARYVRAWKDRNPSKQREYKQRRKAWLRGALVVERFSPQEIYERDKWLCGICGGVVIAGSESLDHIIPVSQGGAHTRANVRLAHHRCNNWRGAR